MLKADATAPLLRILLVSLMLGGLMQPVYAIENNLSVTGTLVNEPCELDPSTSALNVAFGTVIEKNLYSDTRITGLPLVIKLVNCDLSLGSQVALTFKGTESTALPGFLATTGAGSSGVVIGLALPDGTPLAFNQQTPAWTLTGENNTLTLNAYVAAEPEAISAKSLTPGDFTATATFEVSYP
ncbi:fimbrial protein [Pseudescherichia vulneris]